MPRTLVFLGLMLVPAVAQGQTIHGVVVEDGTTDPVPDALVELLDPNGREVAAVRTDRSGSFLLRLPSGGTFVVRLSRLGYTDVETETVSLESSESLSVELRLARAAIPLEPLVVRARAESRGMGGFHERMNRPGAVGHFITRDRIERRRAAWATDILREIPGVYLHRVQCRSMPCGNLITMRGLGTAQEAGFAEVEAGDVVPAMRHVPTGHCLPTVYVDGIAMDQGETLDVFMKPDILEGVEVYPRGSTAPSPLLARGGCGVVAFWTRGIEQPGFSLKRFGAWLGGMVVVFGLASTI